MGYGVQRADLSQAVVCYYADCEWFAMNTTYKVFEDLIGLDPKKENRP
jgi:hypothetical protein